MTKAQIEAHTLISARIINQTKTSEGFTFYEFEMKTIPSFLEPHACQYLPQHECSTEHYQWRIWHRFSQVQKLHEQLEQRHKGLPKFQNSLTRGLQGAFNNKTARVTFLESFVNDLLRPRHLVKLMKDASLIQLLGIHKQEPQIKKFIENKLAQYESLLMMVTHNSRPAPISTARNRDDSFELV